MSQIQRIIGSLLHEQEVYACFKQHLQTEEEKKTFTFEFFQKVISFFLDVFLFKIDMKVLTKDSLKLHLAAFLCQIELTTILEYDMILIQLAIRYQEKYAHLTPHFKIMSVHPLSTGAMQHLAQSGRIKSPDEKIYYFGFINDTYSLINPHPKKFPTNQDPKYQESRKSTDNLLALYDKMDSWSALQKAFPWIGVSRDMMLL